MKSSVGDNNSWNRGIDIDFISTDPKSNDFLKTKNQTMGAYAGIK
jgi:hypothetical protein